MNATPAFDLEGYLKDSTAAVNRALDDFTQSAVHDPNDAESYLGLADTYGA